jgi:hypothetical protein
MAYEFESTAYALGIETSGFGRVHAVAQAFKQLGTALPFQFCYGLGNGRL